ncbi:MAG: hypothetical protein AAB464_01525 [Patescibacteria group bacterium]
MEATMKMNINEKVFPVAVDDLHNALHKVMDKRLSKEHFIEQIADFLDTVTVPKKTLFH